MLSGRVRLTLLALVSGTALLAGCTSQEAPPIDVGTVTRATVTEVVEAPANVAARATVTVSAPAAGTVATLAVKDGQQVARGQVLLRIDSPTATRALAQAREADAQVASAGGGVSVPRLDLAGLRRSSGTLDQAFRDARAAATAIPDPQLRSEALARVSTAEAEYRAAQASINRSISQLNAGLASLGRLGASLAQAQRTQTRAAVEAAQAAVDALTVRSPIAGTVVFGSGGGSPGSSGGDLSALVSQLPSSVQGQASSVLGSGPAAGAGGATGVTGILEVGTPVTPGGTLLTVTDVSALSLAAAVDETDVLLVTPGVTADVELDAVPGATYPGTVRSVDLQPTASSRGGVSFQVRLSLGAGTTAGGTPAPVPRPGMSAVARLKVRTATDAVSVPAASVFRDGPRDAVWVVQDGTARRRDVQLGAQGDDRVEVTTGLTVGDRVIVRGADRVTEGQQVSPS